MVAHCPALTTIDSASLAEQCVHDASKEPNYDFGLATGARTLTTRVKTYFLDHNTGPWSSDTPVVGQGGAFHIIQRVQCTVGVRVTVEALRRQSPSLLHRQSLPSTPPFLPGLGVGGPLAVFCFPCFVSASAVLSTVLPRVGPLFFLVQAYKLSAYARK